MFRLYEFIRSTYLVVLFVIAEGIAISHYASSDSYTRAKMLVVSNSVMGRAQKVIHNTTHLFELPVENRELSHYIAELELKLGQLEQINNDKLHTPILFENPEYTYIVGRVVSNSINKRDNFLVLDKGVEDGVRENMAVITPNGEMLGYITGCSSRYSAALSILSANFSSSGKLKEGEHFGSIRWSGENRYEVMMTELSKYALINVGDTVVSTGFSQIFPPNIHIGEVKAYEFNEMETAYRVTIELAADLSATDYVLIVGHRDSDEVYDLLGDVESKYN